MKLYKIKKTKFIIQCPECLGLSRVKINDNNFICRGECKNGHIFDNLSFEQFKSCIKNIWCSKNYENKNNNNNINCYNCNKSIYCNCDKLNITKDINNEFCSIHNLKYDFYSNNNKINLCEECQKLIPYVNNKKEIKSKINEYNRTIKELIEYIELKKEEIVKRFEKLKDFLNILSYINETILYKFNYSIYDNYNYENFDYFFNYQNNGECFNKNKYLKYLLIGSNLNINQKNILISNPIKEKNNLEKVEYVNTIGDYTCLNYFKDNKFYSIDLYSSYNILKIFDIIDSSFKLIYTYKFNNIKIVDEDGNYKYYRNVEYFINNEYSHFIFIFSEKKDIYILEYNDSENKIFIKEKIDIGESHSYKGLIENKNGNIVLREKKKLSVWKKNKELFEVIKDYKGYFYDLYNINDLMFLSVSYNNDKAIISFYETEKYNKIKYIRIPIYVGFIKTINNELLFILDELLTDFYIINIKFLEIVQIYICQKSKGSFVFNNRNNIFKGFIGNDELIIKNFNLKEGCFTDYEKIKTKINTEVKITDNNFVSTCNRHKLEIFKLLNN